MLTRKSQGHNSLRQWSLHVQCNCNYNVTVSLCDLSILTWLIRNTLRSQNTAIDKFLCVNCSISHSHRQSACTGCSLMLSLNSNAILIGCGLKQLLNDKNFLTKKSPRHYWLLECEKKCASTFRHSIVVESLRALCVEKGTLGHWTSQIGTSSVSMWCI